MKLDRCLPRPLANARVGRWLAAACLATVGSGAIARDTVPAQPIAADKLRPGHYGRIDVRGAPPPVVYEQAMVARPSVEGARPPVYLYVPPGQVRRWAQHCAKWDACERPVYFVRVDNSPSRLGAWKKTQRPLSAESPLVQALNRFTS